LIFGLKAFGIGIKAKLIAGRKIDGLECARSVDVQIFCLLKIEPDYLVRFAV
jgi:hypothetical protein